MKIGKGPKRFGGPSRQFLARKAAMSAEGRPVAGQKPSKDGPINVFLDDERPCPTGWTLVRDPHAFEELLDAMADGRIVRISLDWHLGTGIVNGEEIVRRLVSRMRRTPALFSNLELVRLHSSDRTKAIDMMHTVEQPLREGWTDLPFFSTDLGLPDMHGRDLEPDPTMRASRFARGR